MRNRYWLACGAFSCAEKGQRHSGCGERPVLRPSFLCSHHPRSSFSKPFVQNGPDFQTPEGWPEAGTLPIQIPSDAVGLDRLGATKPKIVHATKNTPIYLHKVQTVLSFPFLARFFGRKLSTLSVPSATPSPGWPQLWWKTSKARRQGASREDAASKAPFARPSIKGVHHAGMHA